jgi:death-on-curing protein
MHIPLTEKLLKNIYAVLVAYYKHSANPICSGYPIVEDFNRSMLKVCVNKPSDGFFGKVMYPHVLQKASVTMHSIVNFHPFIDGNKRMGLLATQEYLLLNGYFLNIPYNADDFIIDIADVKKRLSKNDVLNWLIKHTVRTPYTVLYHVNCIFLIYFYRTSLQHFFVRLHSLNYGMFVNLVRLHKKFNLT